MTVFFFYFQPKPKVIKATGWTYKMDLDVNWQCPLCTFVNSKALGSCEVCHSKKPKSPSGAPQLFKGLPNGTAKGHEARKGTDNSSSRTVVGKESKDTNMTTNGHGVKKSSSNEDVKGSLKTHVVDMKNSVKRSLSLNTTTSDQNKKKLLPKVRPKIVEEKRKVGVTIDKSNLGQERRAGNATDKVVTKSNTHEEVSKPSIERGKADRTENVSKWLCPNATCKHENENYLDSCIVCHTEQNAGQSPGEGGDNNEANKWPCRRCTYQNAALSKNCDICETPRVSSIPTPESIPINLDYSQFPPSTSPTSPTKTTNGAQKSADAVNGNEWTCPECTFSCNPPFSKVCDGCGKGKKPESMHNNAVLPKIQGTVDAKPKIPPRVGKRPVDPKKPVIPRRVPLPKSPQKKGPPPQIPKQPSSDKVRSWKCVFCTYVNPYNILVCKMCNVNKQEAVDSDTSYWTCVTCTLVNKKDVTACTACGTVKEEGNQGKDSPKPKVERTASNSSDTKKEQKQSTSDEDKKLVKISSDCTKVSFQPQGVDEDSAEETKPPKAAKTPVAESSKTSGNKGPTSPTEMSIKSSAQCHVCTYLNAVNAKECKMCGSNFDQTDNERFISPGTLLPMQSLKRQQSMLTDDLRQMEDEEALELWQHITLFCKQVNN